MWFMALNWTIVGWYRTMSIYRPNMMRTSMLRSATIFVATPLWAKWENATPTPKSGDLESFGTLENSEDDLRGQISSPWCVFYVNEKVLKSRCPKWTHMSHLDIYSPSYGQKKGRESNWQFDSRPLKVGNRPLPEVRFKSATWR